jgi:hypothetical protein
MAGNGTVKAAKKDGGNGIFIESSPLFLDVERHILLCREMGGGENDVRAVVVLLPLLPCPPLSMEMGVFSREDGAP